MSRTVAASVLIAFTLTGCGSTVTDSDSPTASSFATSANAATATTAPAQPKTLEAATAVAQEWVDRRAAGDYAGVWLLFSEQVREGISQENYVTVSETCTSSLTKLPSTVNGVRLDGPDKAITRLEAMEFKLPADLVYEGGQWLLLLLPTPEFAEDLGEPVQQMIDERKAEGDCEAQ
ncbi:hypothetical protein [Mycobacterium gallinarum]|nr:hypothetical protein [Mycobacterium gallinarum]